MSAPRALQPSFARGEISPLLFARVDLAAYAIGLRYQMNMITLPQGGVTRRPGFERLGPAATRTGATCPVRLMRFVYNKYDAMMIELFDKGARIWRPSTRQVVQTIETPYAVADIHTVKFVQSGNVIFMTHRDYPVQMLTRNALDDWTIEPLEFKNGPWMPTETTDGVQVLVRKRVDERYNLVAYNNDGQQTQFFTPEMVGSLVSMTYTVDSVDIEGESEQAPAEYISEEVEVGGTWYLRTYNAWKGRIILEKSLDAGGNWITVEDYNREDPNTQGQLEISKAETEPNVIYRVRAQHQAETNTKIRFIFTAAGYTKTYNFRIVEYVSESVVIAEWIKDKYDTSSGPMEGKQTSDWRIGAWSYAYGFPGGVNLYQDRLMLAGNWQQPNNEWGSRTGDYADFGTSDPIQEDDAINITINSQTMDGIHSLVSLNDLLAFTPADEWKTKGYGDSGAITPTAFAAHMQTNTGSKDIQPLVIGNAVVFVDSHGVQVHTLGYSLDIDGYSGSEISIMSSHLLQWLEHPGDDLNKRVVTKMAWQRVPDGILWLIRADGSMLSCTLQMEQQVNAWSQHKTDGRFGDIEVIPSGGYDQLWAVVERDGEWGIEVMAPRVSEALFTDAGRPYESCIRTLRVNYDSGGGTVLSTKKLLARAIVYTTRSVKANIAPAHDRARKRVIEWEYSAEMAETDVQLDNGFRKDAGIEIWTDTNDPLTILGISPSLTAGG